MSAERGIDEECPVVSTSCGDVRGVRADGIDSFLGIPYAAAPIGPHRFAHPAPHPGWSTVRDATAFGPTAPQAPYGGGLEDLLPTVSIPGDEYLNVNVFSPEDAVDLPVMVWVHGGSLAHGSNALAGYDGTSFARDGVVFVSVNYRLGAEGFSVLDGVPLNLGLADVVAALRWVQDEIASFGGDHANVTVFGESAGSILLGTLLAHPAAGALFTRAILQSGAPTASGPKTAGRISQAMGRHLGIAQTRAAFAALTPDELVAASTAVTAKSTPITGGAAFAITIGDDLVPRDPMNGLLAGAGSRIPVMIGATTEEYRLWFVPTGLMDRIGPLVFAAARVKFKISGRILKVYKRNRPGARRAELFGALATDLILRLPINRLADARRRHGGVTHVYEFAWRSKVMDLGASHVMELGFVFDGLASPDWQPLTGREAPQALADAMHKAWIDFAKTGDPGWRPWDEARPTQVFDAPTCGVVNGVREDERSVWGP